MFNSIPFDIFIVDLLFLGSSYTIRFLLDDENHLVDDALRPPLPLSLSMSVFSLRSSCRVIVLPYCRPNPSNQSLSSDSVFSSLLLTPIPPAFRRRSGRHCCRQSSRRRRRRSAMRRGARRRRCRRDAHALAVRRQCVAGLRRCRAGRPVQCVPVCGQRQCRHRRGHRLPAQKVRGCGCTVGRQQQRFDFGDRTERGAHQAHWR